ncbi:proline-rich protein 2-like [Heteronotia binoei]|uniref:proline-rich protein 2-like n=1 Tax=Heteronotia binoei TaxID=13085 RepID=UPI00292EE77D|nr:proline-rich protein 2-like [Heteronotia binoei]
MLEEKLVQPQGSKPAANREQNHGLYMPPLPPRVFQRRHPGPPQGRDAPPAAGPQDEKGAARGEPHREGKATCAGDGGRRARLPRHGEAQAAPPHPARRRRQVSSRRPPRRQPRQGGGPPLRGAAALQAQLGRTRPGRPVLPRPQASPGPRRRERGGRGSEEPRTARGLPPPPKGAFTCRGLWRPVPSQAAGPSRNLPGEALRKPAPAPPRGGEGKGARAALSAHCASDRPPPGSARILPPGGLCSAARVLSGPS